ncbi:NTP transferase domain-containing protein [Herbiconiux sp. KACC 21604]|uniref:NTP transferase domain-containing protein n=1 Tax=unclassified Herbiconiux TaxID=2618217 RepID=UPI0014922127|nr:NTP transferase domain-containing protein [Herbiconiux sp. SALV-R1]QJU55059.1 NTP transferase domain-containing protein [Herbiconiux sp. SALV-R1]WPO86200.1 NTP transferase domain-containing protein [Herbiconiux sp. KACC 21604]
MHVDVIVLAGGRSSRVDGVAKASLVVGGATLLQRAVVAGLGAIAVGAAGAAPGVGAEPGGGGRLVVVGPDDETTALGDVLRDPRLAGGMLLRARETPPFGGPAAAIAAGLAALRRSPEPTPGRGTAVGPFVAVIACDHPRVEHALPLVLAALRDRAEESIDAWMAQGEDPPPLALVAQNARITHDESTLRDQHQGRLQPLLAVYRRASLDRRVNALRRERPGGLDGASVRQLIDGLALLPVRVPTADTADIDTWADAARFGAQPPTASDAARPEVEPPTASDAARFGAQPPTASDAARPGVERPTASAAARFAAQPTTASDAVLQRPTTIGGSS